MLDIISESLIILFPWWLEEIKKYPDFYDIQKIKKIIWSSEKGTFFHIHQSITYKNKLFSLL